jgi:DNA-binding HxlR family transcriptional regulator
MVMIMMIDDNKPHDFTKEVAEEEEERQRLVSLIGKLTEEIINLSSSNRSSEILKDLEYTRAMLAKKLRDLEQDGEVI